MPVRGFVLAAISPLLVSRVGLAQPPGLLTLKDGDRIVLLGSALVEHEQFHGYLETRLTSSLPLRAITFRNLGWSGDTVRGAARTSGFQNPDGFARLLAEVKAQKPTVIFIGYGTNESFAGPAGLPAFLGGITTLLDQLAPLGARIVVLSPAFHEDLGRPFPDPAEHNRNIEQYTSELEKLAGKRKHWFVDLFHPLAAVKAKDSNQRLTTNGVLPNDHGYWLLARHIERQLFKGPRAWNVELDSSGKILTAEQAAVVKVKAGSDGLAFDLIPSVLPPPRPPVGEDDVPQPCLRVKGLATGRYLLRINGQDEQVGSAEQWATVGMRLWPGPAKRQTEKLRAAIVRKSEHFYWRWRPFNDHERHWTYIGGDFKRYDEQVAQEETVIGVLRRPMALRCEVVPVKGEK